MRENIVARNNVRILGHGTQPMLFAHGFGCDQHMWRFLTAAFAAAYQVVLFDYVGAGQADRQAYSAARYGTLDGYAQDVLDICHALALAEVIFVGHSVSCMIGLLAAIRAPALFSRLILLGPSPRYLNAPDYVGGFERADLEELLALMDQNYLGWASYLAPVVMQNPDRPELTRELEQSFCSTDPTTARQFAEVTFFSDNRADLARCPVPALIIQCSDDALAPLAVGDYLQAHLPHSTLRILQARGHCPHMSHPAETIALLQEYLAGGATG